MLRFGEMERDRNTGLSGVIKILLVYFIIGDIFKLREHLDKFLIQNFQRNLKVVLGSY